MSEEMEEIEIELPPQLVQFVGMIKKEQKMLLKDKAFADPNQLRKYIATGLMERLIQTVEMLGTTMLDTHQLGVSNAVQLQGMRRWTAKHLRGLGVEVNDGEAFAGVGTEQIDKFAQAFYALGTHLSAKYPNDTDTQEKFNAVAGAFNQLLEALMGNQASEEDEDEEDEEDEEEDEEEEEPAEVAASSDEPAPEAP